MAYKDLILSASPIWYFTFENQDLENFGSAANDGYLIDSLTYSANPDGPGDEHYVTVIQDGVSDSGWAGFGGPNIFNDGVFSISLWFRSASANRVGDRRELVGCYGGAYFEAYMDNDGEIAMGFDGRGPVASTDGPYDDDQWHHLFIVASSTTVTKAYVDGVLAIDWTHSAWSNAIDYAPKQFGRHWNVWPEAVWWGDLGQFAIFTQAITSTSTIESFYEDGIPSGGPVSASYAAQPTTASALFTSASVSTTRSASYGSLAFSASALFVDPTLYLVAGASYTALAFSASALMVEATGSGGLGLTQSASAFSASALMLDGTPITGNSASPAINVFSASTLFVNPTASAGTGFIFTASPSFASASFINPALITNSYLDVNIFSASAMLQEGTWQGDLYLNFSASAFSASALMQSASLSLGNTIDSLAMSASAEILSSSVAVGSGYINSALNMSASALMVSPSVVPGFANTFNAEHMSASANSVDPTLNVETGATYRSYGAFVATMNPTIYVPLDDLYMTNSASANENIPSGYLFKNWGSGGTDVEFIDGVPSIPEIDITYDGYWSTLPSHGGTANRSALSTNGGSYLRFSTSTYNGNYAISMWAKQGMPTGGTGATSYGLLLMDKYEIYLNRISANNYRYVLQSAAGSVIDTVNINQNWAHVALRITGGVATLFVNGRNVGSVSGGTPLTSQTQISYASSTSNPAWRLNEIVQIDNRSVSDAEIVSLYSESDAKFIGLVFNSAFPTPTVAVNQNEAFSTLFASAQMMENISVTTNSNLAVNRFSASAMFPSASWQAIWTYVQENAYVLKVKEIGAEIGIAKTIETNNTWIDYNQTTSSANFVFGIINTNDGTGGTSAAPEVPATVAEETCNRTKWGGIFTGTQFMNFYPTFDRYGTPTNPTQGQINGNEDWRYNEFTGPWYYTTTEDSYELIFKTTEPNQILLSGQTTYTLEEENSTDTLEDDTRINSYIEYGLNAGRLYVKYYRDLDEEPIEIIGNTNIADGNNHHIVMQRTASSGYYRDQYVLNTNIGNANQWSLVGGVNRHAVVGQQTIEDKFYSDPFTGEIFHGFEIWIDGELDTRSASFNSTHIAPIVKSLGGRTYIYETQTQTGQVIYNRATTSGIVGTLTTFFARFNTETINALSSYYVDVADMPRFPQEAKIIRRAAIDPPTIKVLSQLALADSNVLDVNAAIASASFVNPSVSTNVKKILRLYWDGPNAVGTNFGATTDGQQYVVDTYSVKYQLSNNPSNVYNVDQADRAGSASPTIVSEPIIIDAWKDANGVERLININSDLDLDQYEAIMFMDYPDNSDENDSILPSNNYVYIQDQMRQFTSRLKQAVVNGKSLYVSSPTLAIKLGIISKETVIEQSYDSNDLISASINPFITTASVYFDTHRNNKYRIINEFPGVTNISGYVMTDAISYKRGLNDEYHLKYAEKADGLSVNDTFFIPSLPIIPSQLNQDYAGYTNNRIVDLHVIDQADIISGSPIAILDGTNYATTLVVKPGDSLSGSAISGKIFVNFVEDALTMGITEYNYATVQTGLTTRLPDEDSQTIQWDYSTSRTTRKLSAETNIIESKGSNGQTSPTYGGGGPLVQAPTSSTFGNIRVEHDAENEAFTSSIYFDESSEIYPVQTIFAPSMTWRGMNWLINVDNGEFIKPLPMTASALMPYQVNNDWNIENVINLTIPQSETINLYIKKEVY